MFNFTYAFPWQHVIKGKWEFNHLTNTNLILRKLSRGCSPMHSKTFYICFKNGEKKFKSGKNRYFISRSYVVPSPFKSGKKSHTFYPKHEWFAVNKVKNKK